MLGQMKSCGAEPLLTPTDVRSMFNMLDVTTKGSVSMEQAERVLKTICGKECTLKGKNISTSAELTPEAFVRIVYGKLDEAAPFSRGAT